jgi:hypothetical protein
MGKLPENRSIELHDSVVAFVDPNNGQVEIGLMPAYVPSSAGVAFLVWIRQRDGYKTWASSWNAQPLGVKFRRCHEIYPAGP